MQALSNFLSGLCPNSKFDSKYTITKKMLQKTSTIMGFRGTTIYAFRDEHGRSLWRMELPNDTAHVEVHSKDFPFGARNWTLFGKDSCTDREYIHSDSSHQPYYLNLNGCTMLEYGCHNGECIDVQKRCDGEIDCSDKSGIFTKTIFIYCRMHNTVHDLFCR